MRPLDLSAARSQMVKSITVLAFILSSAVILLGPATPLLAETALVSLSPSNGYVSSQVNLIGTIDTGNGPFEVRWDSQNGTLLKSGTATGINVNTNVTIPEAPKGSHSIFLTDVTAAGSSSNTSTNATSASALFTVNPLIIVLPSSGVAGTIVVVKGTGFGASESGITITWDAIQVATSITADSRGTWSSSFTTVPNAAPGLHAIDAFGSSTGATSVPDVAFSLTAPLLNVSATSGVVGSQVSVFASGFFPNETGITVTYDGVAVATGITAGPAGFWTATFSVPESASRTDHTITAFGGRTADAVVPKKTFNVTPKISLNPISGPVGTVVAVKATGFTSNEPDIVITYDGAIIETGIAANAQGSWSRSLTVPDSASGSRTVDAYGDYTTATTVSDIFFTPTSSIAISPASGGPGTTVTVTATGFAASESGITVTFGGARVKEGISANSKGSWSTTFVVPSIAGGKNTVDAYGSTTTATKVPEVAFSQTATIAVTPQSGVVGDTITVTGTSFGANENGVTVTYDGKTIATTRADANGGWTVSANIPASAGGKHNITAYGDTTQARMVSEVSVTVSPTVAISPASGVVGTPIAISGKGFAASKTVMVTYDGSPVGGNQSTGADGSFSVSFNAPRSKGGDHKITVTDGANSKDLTWSMDSTPPAVPAPGAAGSQITGIFGNVPITLSWSGVTDPSGVYYTLQVDTSSDFSKPFVNKDGLTETTYITDKLAMGTYYWRVKAVDGAYNESAWSATTAVKVGLIPFWVMGIAIVILVLLVVAGVLRVIRRKPSAKKPEEKPQENKSDEESGNGPEENKG